MGLICACESLRFAPTDDTLRIKLERNLSLPGIRRIYRSSVVHRLLPSVSRRVRLNLLRLVLRGFLSVEQHSEMHKSIPSTSDQPTNM